MSFLCTAPYVRYSSTPQSDKTPTCIPFLVIALHSASLFRKSLNCSGKLQDTVRGNVPCIG